jgi:hypothetical protein
MGSLNRYRYYWLQEWGRNGEPKLQLLRAKLIEVRQCSMDALNVGEVGEDTAQAHQFWQGEKFVTWEDGKQFKSLVVAETREATPKVVVWKRLR